MQIKSEREKSKGKTEILAVASALHISQLYLILQLDLILHQFCMVFFIFGLSKERYQYL